MTVIIIANISVNDNDTRTIYLSDIINSLPFQKISFFR